VTLSASPEEVQEAALSEVTLVHLSREHDDEFKSSWADEVYAIVRQKIPLASVDWWIGHDVKSGELAIEMSRRAKSGKTAVIMHMSYDDYQYAKHPGSASASSSVKRQQQMFSVADASFGVGPLLFDRVQSLGRSTATCKLLIPGLPEPARALPRGRLSAITFGRFEPTEALIKQAPLAVAGFAAAYKAGRHMGVAAFEDAALHVVGVPEDQVSALNKIAEQYAERLLNIGIHSFIENRAELRSRLEQSNLSMMLSWHEGFGLTGWEAIGMGIPTIISRESGVWRLLNGIGGQATGCVQVIDVRGASGKTKFKSSDLDELRETILRMGMNLPKYLADADHLSRLLQTQLCYTWSSTATTLAKALELPLKAHTVGATGLDREILSEHEEVSAGLDQAGISGALRLAEAFIGRGQYDSALATLENLDNQQVPLSLRLEVLLLKGESLLRLNRYSEAQELVNSVRQLVPDLPDGCQKIRAESILNTIHRDQGDYDLAVEIGRSLVRMAESSCPAEIASTKRKLARALALQGNWQEAREEAMESLTLAKAEGNALGRAKALLAIGEACRHGLNQVEAIQAYTDSRNLAGKAGHVDCYLWAALGLADSLFLVGEVEEAAASLERLQSFVANSNQGYPLEALHISLSRAVIAQFKGESGGNSLGDIVSQYETLGVKWPRQYVAKVLGGDYLLIKKF
jgi:tetratricopeptide (TPR) repeat protein